ncbi:MAG: hypothetical protein ABI703_05055 [Gemmatimonadales bacterium]
MRSLFAVLLAATLLAPKDTAAQSASPAVGPKVADSILAAPAAVAKKKGGMFGKFKGLAKNKVVNTVAKGALCTVVPGGQVVAGALDAAKTKNAAGSAGAALSGGGGKGGCMPGMAGMAAPTGSAGGGMGAAGLGALAGASAAALPGQPSTGMPGMAMSPEQLKQMQEQYAKMGMDPAQVQAMMAGMPAAAPGGAAAASGPAPVAGGPALSREKGKMLLRRLPWAPASDELQQGGAPMFGMVMQEVAVAIKATPKHYKIEARVEEQGGKAQNTLLAQKRGAAVLAALAARGVPADALSVSEGKADKDPRIIVSEGK